MPNNVLLEVCCDSIESVITAVSAGANRIELCSSLIEGGLTPSIGLIKQSIQYCTNCNNTANNSIPVSIPIPIHILIRPRSGNFCYSTAEIDVIRSDIIEYKSLIGISGIVCGILTESGSINISILSELILLAKPLSFTFNRAFDLCTTDSIIAINQLIELNIDRLLTSGQSVSAGTDIGITNINKYIKLIKSRNSKLIILPGAGITESNVIDIINRTDCIEIHSSCKSLVSTGNSNNTTEVSMGNNSASDHSWYSVDGNKVRGMINAINTISNNNNNNS